MLLATTMRMMSIRTKMMQRSDTRAGASTRGQAMRWAEPLVVDVAVWPVHVSLFFSLFYLERMRIMTKVGEPFFLFLTGCDERSSSNCFLSVEEVASAQGQKRKRSEDDENNED